VRPYLKKPYTHTHTKGRAGLVEWFKVKAVSSSPSTTKKKVIRKLLVLRGGKGMTKQTNKKIKHPHP
jgi:hypothetical protein